MTPLQWFRWRLGTYRAAMGTIRCIERSGLASSTLVDAGCRNSEFMRYVAKRWPKAAVHSFDSNPSCNPIGTKHPLRLGRDLIVNPPITPLSRYEFIGPALLKVDCDADTFDVLHGAFLPRFEWVVAEVSEDGNGSPNNRSDINELLAFAGFNRSTVVDAVVCYLEHRVAQTDVLFWKEKSLVNLPEKS